MLIKRDAPLGLLLLVWAFSSGCIHITDEIDLVYEPRGGREQLAGAGDVPVQIYVVDNRPVQTDVGKINGKRGEIISNQEVSEFIGSAIRKELTARGFASGDKVLISGDIKTLYNRFEVGFWSGDSHADFVFEIKVEQPKGTIHYARTFQTAGLEPNIQVMRGHNAKAALEQAVSKGINELFLDPKFIAALYKAADLTPP